MFSPLYQFTTVSAGDTTPPDAPTLALTSRTATSVVLAYTPPVADYASGEIEYDDGETVTAVVTAGTASHTISGLDGTKTYRFTARARDTAGNWSERSVAVVTALASSTVISQVLAETKLKLEALNLGGAGIASVFKGRRPKNSAQSKRISINIYNGDFTNDGRPGTTGAVYTKFPVHVHVLFKRQDKSTGESQTEMMAEYMLAIHDALHNQRPDDLSTPIENFFLTESKPEDIDTETDATESEAAGLDPTIEGFLTVWWEFWRPV